MAESEYIRGKLEERAGALSSRPDARFSMRGNDVWAHRSGRTYQPSMEGGAADFSSPVTGNGKMGDLRRLVGGKLRKPGSRSPSPERACGGAGLMMTPMEAQQLMTMDYRGGAHPYLTKRGGLRAHLRGSGVWDNIKALAKKGMNELMNPESKLRGEIAPMVGTLASLIPHKGAQALANAASNVSKGEFGSLASSARDAVNSYQRSQGLKKGSKQLAELAGTLAKPKFMSEDKPKPPKFTKNYAMPKPGSYMSDMPEEEIKTYNFSKDYSKPPKPTRQAVNDSAGRPLAIVDKPRPPPVDKLQASRDYILERTRANQVMLAQAKFAKAQAEKAAKAAKLQSRPGQLMLEDASDVDLRNMRAQKAMNKLKDKAGMARDAEDYEVGGGRRRRGKGFFGDMFKGIVGTVKKAAPLLKMMPGVGRAVGTVADFIPDSWGSGTPDLATLQALQRGAQSVGAAKPKRTNRRAQMVAQVMRERGVSLPEASRIVKAEGLA